MKMVVVGLIVSCYLQNRDLEEREKTGEKKERMMQGRGT